MTVELHVDVMVRLALTAWLSDTLSSGMIGSGRPELSEGIPLAKDW